MHRTLVIRVYGCLGMMSPELCNEIQPDYTKTINDVYLDASRYL